MLRYISETADEERQHVKLGTIDLLPSNLKMRLVAPGDWIRIKFDLLPLVRHACGEPFLCSRRQPMCTLGETSLLSVFHDLHLYLGWRCALDIPSQHMTVQLPCRVPVGERYSLLDLYFACATTDMNMDVFCDDYRVLQLIVTTTPPSPSLTLEGKSALLLTDAFAGIAQWW